MSPSATQITALRRPRLLVRAARIALQNYSRTKHLPRVLGNSALSTAPCLGKLADLETELNEQRCAKDAAYSAARHIEVLAALLGEIKDSGVLAPAKAVRHLRAV